MNRGKDPWNIPDKEEHEGSSCPKQVIEDKIDGFLEFLVEWDIRIVGELWDNKLDIGTPP